MGVDYLIRFVKKKKKKKKKKQENMSLMLSLPRNRLCQSTRPKSDVNDSSLNLEETLTNDFLFKARGWIESIDRKFGR